MKTTVIGGGLAGLTCATLLARGGREVTLYEKSKLGGRAQTTELHGALFNLGPHALYRGGRAMQVLRSLGVEPEGRTPPASGSLAWHRGRLHALPVGAVSLLTTSLFTLPEKLEFAALLKRLPTPQGTVDAWLARDLRHGAVREAVRALVRVSTYCDDGRLPARLAVEQLQLALKSNVLYLHGGWRQLVTSLRTKALEAGVRIVEHHKASQSDGETVLAVPPQEAGELLGRTFELIPLRAACLDLALSHVPRPRNGFALGIDRPLYFSLHSRTADLGPHHVLHLAHYGDGGTLEELEGLADAMQPGWREHLVAHRFMPHLTVAHALPGHRAPLNAGGAWLCGDWVGEEGMLLDCALASAAEVARRILEAGTTQATEAERPRSSATPSAAREGAARPTRKPA